MSPTVTPSQLELLTRIDERVNELLITTSKTLEQTQKTNGRVSEIERWRSQVKGITTAIFYVFGTTGAIATLVIGILELLKK